MAGAIDNTDSWIGGDLIIVQLGDLIGRSYDEREVLDFVLSVLELRRCLPAGTTLRRLPVFLLFSGEIEQPPSALGRNPRNDDDNAVMSRHFSEAVGEKECAMLNESLRILGAKRMIVAHTVQETVTSFCDEKVWAIDVGMSRYYGGHVEILELIGDEVTAVLRR